MNYDYKLRNIPEERMSRRRLDGSRNSRIYSCSS